MIETSSVEEIFQKYGEMMYKLCIVMLKKTYDAEDTVQDALIKYMLKKPLFETYEHEKAWLLRVTINLCKDKLRFYKQHPHSFTPKFFFNRFRPRSKRFFTVDSVIFKILLISKHLYPST